MRTEQFLNSSPRDQRRTVTRRTAAGANVIDIAPASMTLLKHSAFELAIRQDSRISYFLAPPRDLAYHLIRN